MRVGRERLIFLALCVVDEAVEAAQHGPVAPSLGLRLALAFLHQVSDGDLTCQKSYRQVFDDFWRTIRSDPENRHPQDGYTRSTHARSCLTQICRQVRMPLTVDLIERLRLARGGEPPPYPKLSRELLASGVREHRLEADQRKEDARKHYWRPPPRPD